VNERRSIAPGHRGLRLSNAPTASVVIASVRDRASLDATLASLLPDCVERNVEVVVARSGTPTEYRDLERAYPSVLFMPGPDRATVRQLRAAGLSAAEGDIVCLIEDTGPVDAEWLADLLAHARQR
jgi:hypothetical protein